MKMPEMLNNIHENTAVMWSITLVTITALISIAAYHINSTNQMARNIEAAIAKGIDPISVKCSYSTNDPICILYSQTLVNSASVSAPIRASR